MKKIVLLIIASLIFFLFVIAFTVFRKEHISPTPKTHAQWKVRSIDTMKYSRDRARSMLHDPKAYTVIYSQVQRIAKTGATHVAIGTPYDEEFLPILRLWVKAARENNLHVWFRGNFSGWERWFSYPPITPKEHTRKLIEFIRENPSLFANGDIFTACPECENGGPGDPRVHRDIRGHQQFLITEYQAMRKVFGEIKKDVIVNYNSMNYDVALLVMDKHTTQQLGGVVTIDHYVKEPEQLIHDVKRIAEKSGGKVVLGEIGVPIPDIHGVMTEKEQALWLDEAFLKLSVVPEVIGVNYWVHMDGTTHLWHKNGKPKAVVAILTKYFRKNTITN